MKTLNKTLIALLSLSSLYNLASCDMFGGETPITFIIESTSDRYILDQETNNVVFSLAEGSFLGDPVYTENEEGEKVEVPKIVTYHIVGENLPEAVIENNTLTATKYGTVTVQGRCGDLVSQNTIDITVCYSDSAIAKNLSAILYENSEGVVLGKTYETSITPNIVDDIKIEGADGLLKINEQGQIEVIGVGYGKIKITNKRTSEVLYDNHYNTFASILCRRVREDLIEQGKISSMADVVTNDMLSLIKEISLSGELINDPEASLGVKYLENLEVLDLSDNHLDNLDFVSTLRGLKKINLSNNSITNLDPVITNEELTHLDLSGNGIEDISKLQYLHKIKELDLSDNNIKSINALSSSYSLESLFVNNNELENYKECLSNLEYLEELGVGHCNIPFTDIISLKYLSNLSYLDVSGTTPNLQTVAGLSQLKTLILEDCKLGEVDISPLNALVGLKHLDLSNNDITAASYNNAFEFANLRNVEYLGFGGNAFTAIPDLAKFTGLQTLDLTSSYNLLDISSLSTLPVKELILDKCNSILVENDAESYKATINAMPNLEKLSVLEGFNYINASLYSYLTTKVQNGELELRFLDNKYVDYTTVYNYSRSVFFDMESFLKATIEEKAKTYKVSSIGETQHVIISLVNDGSALATQEMTLNIDKTLFQMDIYGNHNTEYNIKFNVTDRKQSSFTLALSNFKNSPADGVPVKAAADSKLIINSICGSNSLYAPDQTNAINCHDLTIDCETGSTIYIKGGKGKTGDKGSNSSADGHTASSKMGKQGGMGAAAVSCNSIRLKDDKAAPGITIKGGTGGNGGKGGNGEYENIFDNGCDGGKGGKGGTGGYAVEYKTTLSNPDGSKLLGGDGGSGGAGGSKIYSGLLADKYSNGPKGDAGDTGSPYRKI